MKAENKQFLDDNRHHHFTLVNAQYLKGLNGHEREGMQRVMSEEFQPGYTCDLWCPTCCADMVLRLYRCYDEWLENNTGPGYDKTLNSDRRIAEIIKAEEEAAFITQPSDVDMDNIPEAPIETAVADDIPNESVVTELEPESEPENVAPHEPEQPSDVQAQDPPVTTTPVNVAASFPSNKKPFKRR